MLVVSALCVHEICVDIVFKHDVIIVILLLLFLNCVVQVYDYDRLCPTDDLLGTAELFFSEEAIESDPATGGEKVRADVVFTHHAGRCWRAWRSVNFDT